MPSTLPVQERKTDPPSNAGLAMGLGHDFVFGSNRADLATT